MEGREEAQQVVHVVERRTRDVHPVVSALAAVYVHAGGILVVRLHAGQEAGVVERVGIAQDLGHEGEVLEPPAECAPVVGAEGRAVAEGFHLGTAQGHRVAAGPHAVGPDLARTLREEGERQEPQEEETERERDRLHGGRR